MTKIMCDTAKSLYLAWSKLLEQRRPRANMAAITRAKKEYMEHRKNCRDADCKLKGGE